MASTKDYLEYVLDLLSKLDNITYKKMMGEYVLYSNGILFGGIYDDRFLIKKVNKMNLDFKEEIPYPRANPMYLVDIEDKDKLKDIISSLVDNL